MAGFEHAEYMGALFKRTVGMTPGEYRDRHRPIGARDEKDAERGRKGKAAGMLD